MKKILLGLGVIGATIAPIATVVSCGSSSDSMDISKGDGKAIVNALGDDINFRYSLTGEITKVNSNANFDKEDNDGKYVEVEGSKGTAKFVFDDKSSLHFKIFYKSSNDKELVEVNEGDSNYYNLVAGVHAVVLALR